MHLYRPKPSKKKTSLQNSTKRRLTDFFHLQPNSSSSKPDKKDKLRSILIKSLREEAKAKREERKLLLKDKQLMFGCPDLVSDLKFSKYKEKQLQKKSLLGQIQSLKLMVAQNHSTDQLSSLQGKLLVCKRDLKSLQAELHFLKGEYDSYKEEYCLHRDQQNCRFYGVWPILSNRYQIIRLLGKGGFGEVYLAFDLDDLQEVAIKVHSFEQSYLSIKTQSDSNIKHAMRQFQTQEKMNHPNIVGFKECFELDALSFCMVLEYCPGKDLKHELRTRGVFSQDQVKVIMRQLFSAIDYMHNRDPKVIHFDLKPANILLKEGLIKVADFGLCKKMQVGVKEMELTSFGCGTYYYLPPECFGDKRSHKINDRVDIWSAGVICFQLLYERKPFGQGMKQEYILANNIIGQIKGVQFPDTPLVSTECKDMMRRCLNPDPEKRMSARQMISHPFLV